MSLAIRPLAASELPHAADLLAPEGWSLEPPDLARLERMGGALAAWEGGSLVGFLTHVDTPPYRWVGNVVVHPRQRGQGTGARLVEAAFADAPRAALYSVEKAVPLYARVGLAPHGELHALRAHAGRPSSIPYAGVRPATAADLPEMEALDRDVTRMDRARLLRALLADFPARVVHHHGRLLGFAVAKTYPEATEIGPVIAQTSHAAWGLIDEILRTTRAPHDLVVHRLSKEAERRGFAPMFSPTPMFRGGPPEWDLTRYHAAAGLELG